MLENDPRARGPAGQVLLRSLKVKALRRHSLTQEMSVVLSFFGSIGAMLRKERLLHGLCHGLRTVRFRGVGGLLCS